MYMYTYLHISLHIKIVLSKFIITIFLIKLEENKIFMNSFIAI